MMYRNYTTNEIIDKDKADQLIQDTYLPLVEDDDDTFSDWLENYYSFAEVFRLTSNEKDEILCNYYDNYLLMQAYEDFLEEWEEIEDVNEEV